MLEIPKKIVVAFNQLALSSCDVSYRIITYSGAQKTNNYYAVLVSAFKNCSNLQIVRMQPNLGRANRVNDLKVASNAFG